MYLKEVIINGFKSFAGKTRLELERGITAIVGPNGCGKSNIVDAIRWVLGEQSAKALRGGKMEDVIFSGTDTRPSLPFCEVILRFTDCEDALGTAFNEVEVMRCVTREGGSDYFLNGKGCRLKDIQQLFMDTGIGRVSYSFMVQGQIDQILSANPTERRFIFEEAAGISRYKSQRREALNKLALVDQNLARVTDIIEEVQRQMNSLKRQAMKAVRYKRVKQSLRHLELGLFSWQFIKQTQSVNELQAKANDLLEKVQGLQATVEECDILLETKKSERNELYDGLQTTQQRVFDLKSEKDQAENQIHFTALRKKDAEGRITDLLAEIKQLEKEIKTLHEKTASNAQIKQLQLNLVDTSDEEHQKRQIETETVQQKLQAAEGEVLEKKRTLLQAENNFERLQTSSNQLEVELKTNIAKQEDFSQKKNAYEQKLSELIVTDKKIQTDLDKCTQEETTYSSEVKALEDLLNKQRETLRNQQKQVQDEERLIARLNAQLSILEDLQIKLEGFSTGSKAILQGKADSVLAPNSYRLLMKGIEVDEAYTLAFEALMGQSLDIIALEEACKVPLVANLLAEKQLGSACIQIKKASKVISQKTPDSLLPVNSVIKITNKELAPYWLQLLEGCYFVESLEMFFELFENNPDFPFTLVATLAGELIDGRGIIYLGIPQGKGKESSFIKRESEIKTLRKRLEEEQAKLETYLQSTTGEEQNYNNLEEKLQKTKKQLLEATQKASILKIEQRQIQNNLNQEQSLLKNAKEYLEYLEKTQGVVSTRLKESKGALEKNQLEVQLFRQTVLEKEQAIAKIREERDYKRDLLSEIKLDLVEKKQRLTLIDQGLNEVETQKQQIEKRKLLSEKEIDRLKDKISEYQSEGETLEIKMESLEETLSDALKELQKQKASILEKEKIIKEKEEAIGKHRKDLTYVEGELKQLDMRVVKGHAELQFLVEKTNTDYAENLETIDWRQELWKVSQLPKVKFEELEEESLEIENQANEKEPEAEELEEVEGTVDWIEVESEVKVFKSQLQSIGMVNLVAIEEYTQHKERFEFLSTQSKDLNNSKNQLLQAIEEINKTSQELFAQTFEKVRENFRYTFEKLFGGGEADLHLLEESEEPEAGIEIVARPPGTKLRSLTLLSGGQKTLTALALLFGIYMVKPSPFCVLDELDAPLDDANVGRFTELLNQFTQYSQFLIISHNKRTIAAAKTIYGVTMQEKGVTKLISMRLNKDTGVGTEENKAPEAPVFV